MPVSQAPKTTAEVLGRAKDATGFTSGILTAVRPVRGPPTDEGGPGVLSWVCRCQCGKEVTMVLNHAQMPKSCGCQKVVRRDLTGKVFGRLTVVAEEVPQRWLCACTCGGKRVVLASSLTFGYTKSCGCLKAEIDMAKRPKNMRPVPWYLSSNQHASQD